MACQINTAVAKAGRSSQRGLAAFGAENSRAKTDALGIGVEGKVGMIIRLLLVVSVFLAILGLLLLPRAGQLPQDVRLEVEWTGDPLRIVVFGTSLSANPQVWPDRVAASLSDCSKREVLVERMAAPGMGSAWALGQIEAVQALEPDIVLIEFAINDADILDGVSHKQAAVHHGALLMGLRKAVPDAALVLMTMSPAQGLRGWVRPWLANHYEQYRSFAEEFGVGLIDFYPRWLALDRERRGLAVDGLHPDPETAASVIVPVIEEYLAEGLGCR